jgi:hypothetical protein
LDAVLDEEGVQRSATAEPAGAVKKRDIARLETADEGVELGAMAILSGPNLMHTRGDRQTALSAPPAALLLLDI